MAALSIGFHLAVLCVILFVPDSLPIGRSKAVVYEVNLVEMSSPGSRNNGGTAVTDTPTEQKKTSIVKKDTQAKRIGEVEKTKKPLVLAKRTIKKKSSQDKKPTVSSSHLIDQAISKIEKKVKPEDSSHLDKALSKLAKTMDKGYDSAPGGGGAIAGLPIRIYQMEVENRIKSNWSYPVAVDDRKDLEAVVVVKVKRDGTIMDSRFISPSSDTIFDQSVLKAIEKSDPLPPFPEGYGRKYDEIEISFNLTDL